MDKHSTPETKIEDVLQIQGQNVSRSTDRRYNEVVQEYMKSKVLKSNSTRSNVSPSQVLTLHADKAGPEEGSYVGWEIPDTPHVQRLERTPNNEQPNIFAPYDRSGSLKEDPFSDSLPLGFLEDAHSARESAEFVTPNSRLSPLSSAGSFNKAAANSEDVGLAATNRKETPVNPFTPPAIRVISVRGSSRSVYDGQTNKESSQQTPGSEKLASPAERMKRFQTPENGYTPKECDAKTYNFKSPEGSTRTFMVDSSTSRGPETNGETNKESVKQILWPDKHVSPAERMKRFQAPENSYPPDETDTKTYNFKTPDGSARTFIIDPTPNRPETSPESSPVQRGSIFSNRGRVRRDLDYDEDQEDYERKNLRLLRCSWCLIFIGVTMIIISVVVLLAIEIPAHKNFSGNLPSVDEIVDKYNEDSDFQEFILSATTFGPGDIK